jgi:hypothetical protein
MKFSQPIVQIFPHSNNPTRNDAEIIGVFKPELITLTGMPYKMNLSGAW